MEQTTNEAIVQKKGGARLQKSESARPVGGKKTLMIVGIVLAVLALLLAAYAVLCAYAASLDTFYPHFAINGVDVSGLTVQEAQQTLEQETPRREIPIYDAAFPTYTETDPRTPLMTVTLAELGFSPEAVTAGNCIAAFGDWAKYSMDSQQAYGFWEKGKMYLRALTGSYTGAWLGYELSGPQFEAAVDTIVDQLSVDAVDSSYTLGDDSISITKAQDGRTVDQADLRQQLITAGSRPGSVEDSIGVDATFITVSARTLTAQEIYDEVSSEVRNAGYDAATQSIIPEQVGADFDVAAAQAALDAAEPGETVEVDAEIEYPEVTADELEAVLFRDVLGEAQTKVGGTAARKSNVNLSAATINNYVMNTGDIFSYNGVVGQRTAARGYKPAPAYVKGETVDEIGGGICQTSSTLYLACLRANLEITERYAHRYIPSYIAAGMDATVSWGGPDYKFTNNTSYPIKIETEYAGGYLTVRVLGTNVTGITAKMTNEKLSTTNFEVVYEDDPTLSPGQETVKTTPYTGSKWRTYRHLYDKDGKLISSTYEDTSDYKVRNKVILRGPADEAEPAAPVISPSEIPSTPEEPGTAPAQPEEPPVDETPGTPIIVLPEDFLTGIA